MYKYILRLKDGNNTAARAHNNPKTFGTCKIRTVGMSVDKINI